MCAANFSILSASLHQGVGENGEVRRCENEKHILCKACCNLTEDGEVGNQRHHQHSHHEHQQAMREVLFALHSQVCPLCGSGIMGQHNVLEQVPDSSYFCH